MIYEHNLDVLTCFTDGSYTPPSNDTQALCGWGIAVAKPGSDCILDFCVPISLVDFETSKLSNNVGELVAIILLLEYFALSDYSGDLRIVYDSTYAFSMLTGLWKPTANFALIKRRKQALSRLRNVRNIVVCWQHVYSHSLHPLNARADALAKLGFSSSTSKTTFQTILSQWTTLPWTFCFVVFFDYRLLGSP